MCASEAPGRTSRRVRGAGERESGRVSADALTRCSATRPALRRGTLWRGAAEGACRRPDPAHLAGGRPRTHFEIANSISVRLDRECRHRTAWVERRPRTFRIASNSRPRPWRRKMTARCCGASRLSKSRCRGPEPEGDAVAQSAASSSSGLSPPRRIDLRRIESTARPRAMVTIRSSSWASHVSRAPRCASTSHDSAIRSSTSTSMPRQWLRRRRAPARSVRQRSLSSPGPAGFVRSLSRTGFDPSSVRPVSAGRRVSTSAPQGLFARDSANGRRSLKDPTCCGASLTQSNVNLRKCEWGIRIGLPALVTTEPAQF